VIAFQHDPSFYPMPPYPPLYPFCQVRFFQLKGRISKRVREARSDLPFFSEFFSRPVLFFSPWFFPSSSLERPFIKSSRSCAARSAPPLWSKVSSHPPLFASNVFSFLRPWARWFSHRASRGKESRPLCPHFSFPR